MKAVIGVGFQKHCLAVTEVFTRLGFPGSEAVLVHTVEPVLPDAGFMPADYMGPIAEIQRQRKEDGEKRMAEVAEFISKSGIPSRSVTSYGFPAHEITALADKESADLVIVGSEMRGGVESFLMGSVSRALVTGAHTSILVGKAPVADGEKLNAVFATDHSAYAGTCADLLVRLAPRGLGAVTVVSADTTDPDVQDALRSAGPEGLTHEHVMERKNQEVCSKLRKVCEKAESVVMRGTAEAVIDAVMKRSKADLLILGAHGHGFLERLLMGSTALHMVGNAPWNVLVLRA